MDSFCVTALWVTHDKALYKYLLLLWIINMYRINKWCERSQVQSSYLICFMGVDSFEHKVCCMSLIHISFLFWIFPWCRSPLMYSGNIKICLLNSYEYWTIIVTLLLVIKLFIFSYLILTINKYRSDCVSLSLIICFHRAVVEKIF